LEVFEEERRGGEEIFLIKYVWFNFYKGREGERRGANYLQNSIFASLLFLLNCCVHALC
jgi:hypothetical protein